VREGCSVQLGVGRNAEPGVAVDHVCGGDRARESVKQTGCRQWWEVD
jgi:hypothetical protein